MNTLERKVLEMIGEDPDSPDVFVDTDAGIAPVRDSINDAIQEIAMLKGGNKRSYLIPLRKEQMFYRFKVTDGYFAWVSDAWDVTRKFRLEQTDHVRLSQYDPRWMEGTGLPEAYMQFGEDVIGFYKKPSASTNAIELTIVEIPVEYKTSTERVKLREEFKHAAIHYAVADYWASRGDANEAFTHTNTYLECLGIRENYRQSLDDIQSFRTSKEPWPTGTA